MAAFERVKELADNWLEKYENHLVIVTSNTGLTGLVNKNNVSMYMLPDPKSKDAISPESGTRVVKTHFTEQEYIIYHQDSSLMDLIHIGE